MELQALCDKVEVFPLSQQLFLHLHQQSGGLGANSIPLYDVDDDDNGREEKPPKSFLFFKTDPLRLYAFGRFA